MNQAQRVRAISKCRGYHGIRRVQNRCDNECDNDLPSCKYITTEQLDLRCRKGFFRLFLANDLGKNDDGKVQNCAWQCASTPYDKETQSIQQQSKTSKDRPVRTLHLVVTDAHLLQVLIVRQHRLPQRDDLWVVLELHVAHNELPVLLHFVT